MNTSVDQKKGLSLRLRLGRACWRLAPIALTVIGVACADYYRPVALPIQGPSPTPAPSHFIYSVSSNGTQRGGMSRIDVSGDSVMSSIATGIAPVHGALTTDGTRLYVANSGDDSVSVSPGFGNTQGTVINLVQLCPANGCPAVPVFVTTTESNRMYVADKGNGTVSVLDTNSNVVIQTIAVNPAFSANPPGQPLPLPDSGSKPIALAELPSGTKIYSINSGNNTVTSINTVDGSIAKVIGLASSPIWAVASADSGHTFVLDSAGTVSVIDTLSDSVVSSVTAGAGANYLFYDKVFNRLYVTVANAGAPVLLMFDIVGPTLVPHGPGTVAISTAPGSACSANPVPTSVTVLGDGSRAYVASYQSDPSFVCTQATVVDTGTGAVTKTLPLSVAPDNSGQTGCSSARFRTFAASSASAAGGNTSFKVYVSQCDAGTTGVIDTNALNTGPDPHPADTLMGIVPSPMSSAGATQVSISSVSAPSVSACPAATPVTYTYSLQTGSALQQGTTVFVTGMKNSANDGVFVITAATPSTFTVTNSCPATDTSAQTGSGTVYIPQNPVFLVPGP